MSCILAVCLAVGVTANSYSALEQTFSVNIKAGDNVYAWAGHENLNARVLGQSLSALSAISVGLGTKFKQDDLVVFAEIGYTVMESDDVEYIRDEVVYTQLVKNHAQGTRKIPSADPQYFDDAHTSYAISNGMMARVGVGYEYDAFMVSVAYRFQYADERMKLWDDEVLANTGGRWQETNSLDMSALEVGISYRF